MKLLPAALTAHLEAREGVSPRVLAWFEARNRTTGAAEALGLWQGADDRSFSIGGSLRTYYGAGQLLGVDPIATRSGVEVRRQRLVFSALTSEVEQLVRGYDARYGRAEVHVVHMVAGTDTFVSSPVRWLAGYIDEVSIRTGEAGGEGAVEIRIATAARALTQTLGRKRSDRSLRARAPADRFRRYADVSGSVKAWWGELAPGEAPPGAQRPQPVSTGRSHRADVDRSDNIGSGDGGVR